VAGGHRQGEQVGLTDVDVYDPVANTWTHAAGGFPPGTGFTLSGSIRTGGAPPGLTGRPGPSAGGGTGSSYDAYIWATSSSGWDGSTVAQVTDGAGSYSISGIPPGDSITLNAYLVDPQKPAENALLSGMDTGALGPINVDTTQDVEFPDMVLFETAHLSVNIPAGWRIWDLFGRPYKSRPGYPFLRSEDGLGRTVDPVNLELFYYHPFLPNQQDAAAGASSVTPEYCEVTLHALEDLTPAPPPMTLLTPPRSLAPGLNQCTPRGGTSPQLEGAAIYKPGGGAAAPGAVAMGDVNGDQVPDLVVANGAESSVQFLFGNGDGTFTPAGSIVVAGTPTGLALAALHGEPNLSLVVAVRNPTTPQVQIFRGDGQGGFPPNGSFPVGMDPYGVAIGDLSSDGLPDIVVSSTGTQTLSILTARNTGGFNNPITFNLSCPQPHGLVAAKLDTDNLFDVAVACSGTGPNYDNRVQLYRGQSTSPYLVATPTPLNGPGLSGPHALVAADVNGDTWLDLAASNSSGVPITLWRNTGTGGFQTFVGVGSGAVLAQGIAAADVNNDTRVDLICANTAADQVLAFRNDGGGTFTTSPQVIGTPRGPLGLAAGDLNGDGRADVVASCTAANALEVLLQTRPLSTVPEGAYTFTIPAGAGVVQLTRGPELQGMDWQYLAPVGAAQTSVSIALPLTSALALPPPAPAGQIVGWGVQAYKTAADVNNIRFGTVRSSDQLQSGASLYIRQ